MRRERSFDAAALTGGVVFGTIGVSTLIAGPDNLAESVEWLWPIVLFAVGISVLLSARSSARQDGASHEIGTERGEYR